MLLFLRSTYCCWSEISIGLIGNDFFVVHKFPSPSTPSFPLPYCCSSSGTLTKYPVLLTIYANMFAFATNSPEPQMCMLFKTNWLRLRIGW